MPRIFAPFALAAALALAAPPAAGQQFPAQQRGLSADTAYSLGDIDSVNLFNGNLSLTLPLGQSYPVGPAFSLGFSLGYNSKVWDYEEKICQQSSPPQNVVYQLPVPDKYANAGLGWLLTPGFLLDPSVAGGNQNPLNLGPNWIYVSPDGGHHAFYPRLHPGYPATPSAAGTLYSNDGTYLRQKKLAPSQCRAVAGTSGDCRIVEFPDGSRHEFLSFAPFRWRVVRTEDAFGNQVDIDYRFTPDGKDLDWTFRELLRRVYVDYDSDGPLADADQNRNHRLRYRKTVFDDDGGHYAEETRSDFDGLGHWRQTVAAGDFGPSKTSAVGYRPGGGTLLLHEDTSLPLPGNSFVLPAENDRWLFGTYDRRSVRQGAGAEIVGEACFDPDTGFLLRSRQLAGAVPQAFDLLTVNVPEEGGGFLASQRFYGGDGASLPTSYSSLCAMASPNGDPAYQVDHSWSAGSLATSAWIDPCDGSRVLSIADADIDAGTGLPSRVRSASGLATNLVYDAMGRLVAERPDEGAWSNTVFKFPKLGQSTPDVPSVEMESCPPGQADCSGTQRGFSRYQEFDGAGRLVREAMALPAEGDPQQNQDRQFTYNALGWRLSESTWQQQKTTTYGDFDRFGRAGWIQPPGTNPGIGIEYRGERRTTRRTRIELTGGLSDNWVTEERDHFGRLVAVCEAQASAPGASGCSGLLTTYGYDAADRLISVCSRPNGSSCGQSRSFTYDGRGFLLADTHPEIGPAGNGSTSYEYDALGHATHSLIVGSTEFELRSSYDRAGRLVQLEQKAGSVWKPLKEFFYARESDGVGWQGGQLVLAKRHNWVSPIAPEALGNLDAIVADAFEYQGLGGRVSSKITSFRLGAATNAFESAYVWDDFGNLTSQTYPQPLNWPLTRFATPRQVDYGYTLGFLTEVEGFADQISYQLGGMLHQVHYATGATFTEDYNPADHLPRPYRLNLSGVSQPFASGNYGYDGQSQVSQIGSLLYRFDRLGRLVRGDAPNGAGTATQTASFDDFGNLTGLNTGGSVQSLATQESTNRLSGAAYDAAGNLTGMTLAGTHWEYGFDGLRKMNGLRSSSNQARLFFYDANDERVFTWDCPLSSCEPDHNQERWTLRGLGGEVLRTYAGADKFTTTWEEDYVYRGGALLGTIRPGTNPGEEEKRFVATDHLGSVRLVFSESNQTVDRYDFFPFGQETGSVAQGELALKFTGQERDPNGSGKGLLDYFHARFESPITGRFLSTDPVLGRPAQPQSWNRYSYALNNPINYNDPTGEVTANQVAVGVQEAVSDLKHDVIEFGFDVLPSYQAVQFAFAAGSILDFGSGLLEPLRFGDAVGTAAGADASLGDMALAIVQDAGRGATLVAAGAAAAGKYAPGVLEKTSEFAKNAARGRASEARVLKDLGLEKNRLSVSSAEGRSIPDALTDTVSIEIKDRAKVSMTRQLRIQTEAARNSGKESVLITGQNTCVSATCYRSFDLVILRKDLGPP